MCLPTQELQGSLFLCSQSTRSTEGPVARAHTQPRTSAIWLPEGVIALWARTWENTEDFLRLLQVNFFPPTYPNPTRAYAGSSTPWLSIVQAIGLISLEQPNSQCKGLTASDHEQSPAIPEFSSLAELLWFALVSIQMGSVLAKQQL